MFKIYIDSTDRYNKSVALLENGVKKDEINGDIDLVSSVQKILSRHNLKPEDIESYDVNKGPGSFTGLKIGVTIANVINWALGKKSLKDLSYPEYGREPNITKKDL